VIGDIVESLVSLLKEKDLGKNGLKLGSLDFRLFKPGGNYYFPGLELLGLPVGQNLGRLNWPGDLFQLRGKGFPSFLKVLALGIRNFITPWGLKKTFNWKRKGFKNNLIPLRSLGGPGKKIGGIFFNFPLRFKRN